METLQELYQRELKKKDVSPEDIDFVLSLISESELDQNLNKMPNDYWQQLENRGLLEVFERVNRENYIEWHHSNEPEY